MMTATTPRAAAGRRRWWILAVLCLSVLLVVIDNTIVNVALPTMSRDLAASTQGLQWIVDGYTLVFAGLLLVGGNLGDRLGRRRMLQAGLVLFALTSVGAAVYVGDTPADMAAAVTAGARPVGVATGSFTGDELRAAGAVNVLLSLRDFSALYQSFVA